MQVRVLPEELVSTEAVGTTSSGLLFFVDHCRNLSSLDLGKSEALFPWEIHGTRIAGSNTQWHDCLRERWVHPLIALAAWNLDFLCVHPFRDGNGRVSRLPLLLQCYHLGYEVGCYASLERLIEQNKERYYESSR